VTWQKAYGWKQQQPQRVPMPGNAIFDLASMTKPIATGTSLMMLIEQDRVALEDPVGKFLPDFSGVGKEDVTVRHLMTHTSGLPPYVDAAVQKRIQEEAGFPCPAATRQLIRSMPLARPPGKTTVYSCLNAILCAEIVQAVSGEPLDRFAVEQIFAPLAMHSTGFNLPTTRREQLVPSTRAAHGRGADSFLLGQVHDPLAAMQAGVSGNAGLFSTAADVSRFAQMMLNGGALDGCRLLKAQTIRDMTRVRNAGAMNRQGARDRRGLLWDLYAAETGHPSAAAVSAYGHTGYTGTALRIYPDPGVYVIALTNRVHPDDSGQVGAFRKAVWETIEKVLIGSR
jgi:CubicO group peptidase (beta-lactamase class C family)